MKKPLIALLLAGLLPLAGGSASAASGAPVLLELFTSQGCSSCPQADALLGRLAERDGVVALAFHVTYWDRLGWADTFAQEAFTERQQDYREILRGRYVYTPQMVVAGSIDVVGSNGSGIEDAIDRARRGAATAHIAIAADGTARLASRAVDGAARVWAAAYLNEADVAIGRGENGGRRIAYHRIVRDLRQLDSWDGTARDVTLPLSTWRQAGLDGAVLVAQNPRNGQIEAIGEWRAAPR